MRGYLLSNCQSDDHSWGSVLTSDYLDLSVHIRIIFGGRSVWPKEVKDALLEGPHRGLWHTFWKWIL